MTPQSTLSFNTLDEATLRDLARQSGPCLTFCLPARHPGATELPRSTVLLNLLRETEAQLYEAHDVPEDFLIPIRDLLRATNFNDGGEALAIFRAPGFFLLAQASNFQQPSTTLGPHFLIAPFLEDAFTRHEAYVLGLNQKRLLFFHWANGKCLECGLPANVPTSLDAAMAFDTPDHNRVNQSSAGPSSGNMSGVRFGTSSDADNTPTHLHDYFKQIDRGLKELLRHTPLVLAGVPQHTKLYRSIAEHAQILDADLPGDAAYLSPTEIGARLQELLLDHYRQQGIDLLAKHGELRDRTRAISGTDLVFDAAAGGRIHQLVCAVEAAGESNNNAAIAETLRHNGDVYLVPAAAMPIGNDTAAILRY
jgi:hypothetical protein